MSLQAVQDATDSLVVGAATKILFNSMRKHFPSLPLSDAIIIHNGRGLPSDSREASGQYSVFGAGGIVGRHSVTLDCEPFVVIGRKGSAGKPTLAPQGGWVIDTAYYAQPKDAGKLDCEFLYYGLASIDFSNDVIATAIPGINRTAIYGHSLPIPPKHVQESVTDFLKALSQGNTELPPLPPPLSEQRRIVGRLEHLAGKIEEARGLSDQSLKATSVLWKSIGRALLEQVQHSGRVPLRELVGISGGGTPSKGNASFWNGDIPWITPKDMKKLELDGSTDYINKSSH